MTYPSSTKDVEQFAYDHADRATAQTLTHDGADRAGFAYAYNASDQLTSQTDTGDLTASHAYTYDTRGRLTADGTLDLGYDDAGNLTSLRDASLSYDNADRLTSSTAGATSTSYSYDTSGNRTQTAPSTGPVTDYGYDQADQLTSVDDHTGTPISYTYTADGLRATKTKNSQTTHFTWDPSSSTPVLIAKDATRYVYDQDGLALEQIDSDGIVSYLHHDRLGSTRLITNADGSTQATYSYDAYGTRTTTSGTSGIPFGYTGQYTDTDTGLIYLRARYYDPATGQFLTRDPLEAISGSGYGYADGDPANLVDPSGLLFGIPGTPSASALINGVAGFGDHLTLGGTSAIRRSIGNDNVDTCSGAYQAGGWGGEVAALAIPFESEARIGIDAGRAATGGTRTLDAILDTTGKVHGRLPKPADLGRYHPEDLARLRGELEQSVQKRIQKTVELGADYGHSDRLAEEQALIRSIEKHLADR